MKKEDRTRIKETIKKVTEQVVIHQHVENKLIPLNKKTEDISIKAYNSAFPELLLFG
jgi:hypothetical protein